MSLLKTLLETCAILTKKVPNLEEDKIAQDIKITKQKQRVRRLEKKRKLKASGLKRLKKVRTIQRVESLADTVIDDQEDTSKQWEIAELDANKDITLESIDAKDTNVQGRLDESQAKVYHLDLEHAKKVLITTTATTISATQVHKASAPRRRKGVVIHYPEEITIATVIMHSEAKSNDKGK
uniref:Uncharacterized protein n=1 Tax=Tanacetum cinerariifolium TaxID=118510 RepID=A0A699GT92_TANCI|nr:hypothetical protein [Tanacetum cinerariifolium]